MGRSGAGETPQSRDKRGEKQRKLNRRSRRWAQMTKFREARSRSSGGRAPSGGGETERPAKIKLWSVVGRGEFAAKQRKKRKAAKPQPELGHSPAKGRTWANEKEPNPSIRLPAIRLPMLAFQRCCARECRAEQHVPLPAEFSSQAANDLHYCSAKTLKNKELLRWVGGYPRDLLSAAGFRISLGCPGGRRGRSRGSNVPVRRWG